MTNNIDQNENINHEDTLDDTEVIDEDEQQEEEFSLSTNFDDIKTYTSNENVISYILKTYRFIGTKAAKKLAELILKDYSTIHIQNIKKKYKKLYQYNKSKFGKDKTLNVDALLETKKEIIKILTSYYNDNLELYDGTQDITHKKYLLDDEYCYIASRKLNYRKMNKYIYDESGRITFKYDFNKPDIKIKPLKTNKKLQRVNIQIATNGIPFFYPVENFYECPNCDKQTRIAAYKTDCTNEKIECEGIYHFIDQNGAAKSRVCRKTLQPNKNEGVIKDAYYYNVSYMDENGNNKSLPAISFNEYIPGFYDAVVFKINQRNKLPMIHIIDVNEIIEHKINLPEQDEDENYIFTLQRAFDTFIYEYANMDIYGLIPIKIALIIQALFRRFSDDLICNIQVAGDASTGKSTVLKYYGILLEGQLQMSTNGLSVSIPALRGSRLKINIFGKDINIISIGFLGSHNIIHIDEARENKELVQNLKSFIYERNYGYSMVGGSDVQNIKTAHINLSENLDYSHIGQYIGMIRKAYKGLNIKIDEEEKPEWDESWDLFLPLYKYLDNSYLFKVIKEKRDEYKNKKIWWIDGYDYALHERFPFYFYLVNDETMPEELVKAVRNNIINKPISESTELMKALKNTDIKNFFDSLKEYSECTVNPECFEEVNNILKAYGVEYDSRMLRFYYGLLNISRIANKRKEIKEMDYNLIKWVLEKVNRKLLFSETTDYEIVGAPELNAIKEKEYKIEDTEKEIEDSNTFNNFDLGDDI